MPLLGAKENLFSGVADACTPYMTINKRIKANSYPLASYRILYSVLRTLAPLWPPHTPTDRQSLVLRLQVSVEFGLESGSLTWISRFATFQRHGATDMLFPGTSLALVETQSIDMVGQFAATVYGL